MNLALSLVASAERTPERDALVEGGRRLTHAEVAAAAARVAGGLRQRGVGPGDRVAAALRNRTETVLLWWACQWLGATFVPLNWRLRPDEVAYCVTDAGAVVLAVEEASAGVAEAVAGAVATVGVGGADGGVPWERLAAAEPVAPVVADDHEIALMLYTSGTTGRPKGVPRSHRAERAAAIAHIVQHGYADGERTLGVMPLYHTMGQRSLLAASLLGGLLVLQPEFRPAAALEAIAAERLTALYLAPTLFHDLLLAAPAGADLGTARKISYAGAPMTGVLAERVAERFDPDVFVNHYGSTEIYTFTIHGDQRAKPGCAGRAGLNARVRLVAAEPGAGPADLVGSGEVGQVICHLSSDEAFSGYWHRPDADERQVRDGWYYPGDLGRHDADGDLWLVGRTDDMIISGGENVHPAEIEEWLVRHPAVREVAIVAAPDERLGQRVVACVVASQPVEAEELDRHCLASTSIAAFKRPREYRFLDELPKSSSGKILRRVLRDADASNPEGRA